MIKRLFCTTRGAIVLGLYLLFSLAVATSIVFFSLFVYLIPNQNWRHFSTRLLLKWPVWWMDINTLISKMHSAGKWNVHGTGNLTPDGWYMVISNHRSWVDIFVLGIVFNRKIPVLKFFMKIELLWQLPIIGIATYVLGYPYMRRSSPSEIRKNPALKGKDIENTKKACQKFAEHPTSVMNFVEGTRFTQEKREKQDSPFQHLLKPKTAGTAIVVNELHHKLDGILNVTIDYGPGIALGFWDFAKGNFDKIQVRYELLPIDETLLGDFYQDRQYRKQLLHWLTALWEEKDQKIDELHGHQHES